VLREFVEDLVQHKRVTQRQLKEGLFSFTTTGEFDQWVEGLKEKVKPTKGGQFNDEPPF
jgi:hypothetical protein